MAAPTWRIEIMLWVSEFGTHIVEKLFKYIETSDMCVFPLSLATRKIDKLLLSP